MKKVRIDPDRDDFLSEHRVRSFTHNNLLDVILKNLEGQSLLYLEPDM
jgi:hypothetical protein